MQIVTEIINKAVLNFNKHVELYIRENLASIGFFFDSDVDFYAFVKARLTLVSFQDKPNYFEVFLDKGLSSEMLIGCYDNSVKIKAEGTTVYFSFGND